MFKFNLLPPKIKQELELANLYRLVIVLVIWLTVFLIIFALLLAGFFFSLTILAKGQEELIEIRKQDEKIQRLIEMENKIEQINQELQLVYNKQDQLIIWTPLLEELTKITPSGIYLTNLTYQTSGNQVSLSGWSGNRDKLLSFQKSLEESTHFVKVEAPLSNLIKQTDIKFGFTLHLKE